MAAKTDHYDDFILELGRPKTSSADILETGAFLVGMRKRAMADLNEALVEAPPPTPYAVPVEQVVMHVAQLVALLFDINACATFYDTTVGGCYEAGWDASNTARQLLRHISNLGEVNLPPVPGPLPAATKAEATSHVRAKVERVMLSLQNLRGLLGDAPFRFSVEEMLARWNTTLDTMICAERQASTDGGVETKLARCIKLASIMEDPAALYQMRETQLQAAQVANENEFLRRELEQTQQHAALQQTEAEQLGAQAQQLGMQLEQSQMETQGAQQQAMANMELASSAESNAAAQADAKMRLSMRVQQLRQTLADIVSSDPAAEEGAGFEEIAGAGAPMTSVQQQQQADAEAQAAAEAGMAPGGAAPGKAGKEVEEADRAATHAAVQEAQAEQQIGGKIASDEHAARNRAAGAALIAVPGALTGWNAGSLAGDVLQDAKKISPKGRRLAIAGGTVLGAATGARLGYTAVQSAQKAKEKTAGATARLRAADALDSAALNAIPEGQLKNIKTPGVVSRARAAVGDAVERGGQRAAKGFVQGLKDNVSADDVRHVSGIGAQGVGDALNRSANEGVVAQRLGRAAESLKKTVAGASRGAKMLGAGALGLGAVGTGALIYRGNAVERGLKEQRRAPAPQP